MSLESIDLGICIERWDSQIAEFRGGSWEIRAAPSPRNQCIAASPLFELQREELYVFDLLLGDCDIEPDRSDRDPSAIRGHRLFVSVVDPDTSQALAVREFTTLPGTRCALVFCPMKSGRYRLALGLKANLDKWPAGGRVRIARLSTMRQPAGRAAAREGADTCLPHWGPVRRYLHRKCKQSRRINSVVSAIEMRLECEELLSLPQYMSFCPTGQCNAQCDFCSVTINRTGIIKRQIPFEKISSMVAEVSNTVQMFGLEGNGEPTLYREFDELVRALIAKEAAVYLITNASRLRDDQLSLLMGLESINISLNAASADTHKRVMKLKNYAEIVANIRDLMRRRGHRHQLPHVSVSFVVTRYNVGEAVDFLRFADEDLKVDRILIRPLSELGNDLGTVEDLRDLVPFESEIADLIEGVQEYLADTESTRCAEVVFDPGAFKASRPDPLDILVDPVDARGHLMPPRRLDWNFVSGRSSVAWLGGGKLRAHGTTVAAEPLHMRSAPVPIALAEQRELTLTVAGRAPALQLRVLDTAGRELACERLALNGPRTVKRQLKVTGTEKRGAVIEIAHPPCVYDFTLDLGRPRKPSPALLLRNLPLPPPRRWEICMPAARVSWNGAKQSIEWSGNEFLYLVKSYSQPCLPNTTLRYRAPLSTRSGTVGIGVLDETCQTWVATFAYPTGEHIADICFESGRNRRFQIVVYSIGREPLSTVIDWSEAMRPDAKPVPDDNPETTETCERPADSPPAAQSIALAQRTSDTERRVVRVAEPRGESGAESDSGPATDDLVNSSVSPGAAPRSSRATAIAGERPSVDVTEPGFEPVPAQAGDRVPERDLPPTARQRLHRFLMGPNRYYCQKPWTDLNNFTVDGRMDVCCIATGPSQERYQLGNLFNQTFQEVWNGPTAREFRRTVNHREKALPPCVRCPMAYAYQGRFFSSDDGFRTVWCRFRFRPLWRVPGGKRLHFALFMALYGPIHILLYSGFRRQRLLPPRWKIWSWYN